MKHLPLLFVCLLLSSFAFAQTATRQDSLRGSITPERVWWDLTYYHLDIEVIPAEKKLVGSNTIQYQVLDAASVLQVDLQTPLKITKVEQDGAALKWISEGNAHFVQLAKAQKVGAVNEIKVYYEGHPQEAKRAPWDGGLSWKKDAVGNDFVATSCQGLGASVWWPCKDHMYDEVDSMLISIEVPRKLTNVSNGRLRNIETNRKKKTRTFNWFVENPINNYGVNINIGDYVSWKEVYPGEKGPLDVTYWALKVDEKKARKQWVEVPLMLKAFEHWFGPYPFYEDGYQLVQAPYLGMEHQSSITYGNEFQNGYLGRDLSSTGWGLKFDFIIVHESGHEWFANNITHKDMADMWIHEGFTNYSESLFLDYHFGKDAGQEYVRGTRIQIGNLKPMIGPRGINFEGYPGDVYYKGGNLLNTLRTVVNDDELWRKVLRSLGETFYHQTITSAQLESHMTEVLNMDLDPFFDQYLRTTQLPIFEYYFNDGMLNYRWTSVNPLFNMPVDIKLDDENIRLFPSVDWEQIEVKEGALVVDENYYIATLKTR